MAFEIVVIGASLGGLAAFQTVLGGLAASFPLPLVIVQHRGNQIPEGIEDNLLAHLQGYCALPVDEPVDKQPMLGGRVYLAPADYHLLLERGSFSLSTEAPVLYARPSIDVLFESAATVYGEACIGVLLTGASDDGARGLSRISAAGGLTIVEDPASAHCAIMPRAALRMGGAASVVELASIAPQLNRLCRPTARKPRAQPV